MIIVRKATKFDIDGIKNVHYQAWKETYHDIISDKSIESVDLEEFVPMTEECFDNTCVAVLRDRIIGFASFCQSYDRELGNSGEIKAIYMLKKYQGLGVGRYLMNYCFVHLFNYDNILTWTSPNNIKSIEFYHHFGFKEDGMKKEFLLNKDEKMPLLRMRRKISHVCS